MIRIKTTAFSDLNPTNLATAAQENYNAVSTNPEFDGITPPPPVVKAAISDLRGKTVRAKDGTKAQKNARDQAKSILIAYLTQWSNFVVLKAGTKSTEELQEAVVIAAAFEPVKRGSRIRELEKIVKIKAKSASRAVSVSWRSVPGAHLYQVMKTAGFASENSAWTEAGIVSRVRITVPCNPAEITSFIVYPLGASGRGPASQIVTCVAGL